MIYFAQAVGGGPIKIGHASNVAARIAQLEEHYCQPLALLGTLPGGRPEEKAIHQRFAHLRFSRTEQFRPDPDLLAFIKRPLFGGGASVEDAMPSKFRTVVVRSSGAWADWVEELAKHCRTDVAKLIDAALLGHAKVRGFDKFPPKRVP